MVIALLLASTLPLPVAGAAPDPLATSGVDLSFDPPGLTFSDPEPFADSALWVNATVRNNGDTAANATVLFYLGDGTSAIPFALLDITVGNLSSVPVSGLLSTQDLLGYQEVTVRLSGISPAENGTAGDNEASGSLKVHMPGEVDLSGSWVIDQWVNTTGFVTLRGTASLRVEPGGTLWVGQQHTGQFDILVKDNAALHVAGGRLASNLPIRVELQDNATLTITDGGLLEASVRSSSAGTVSVVDSTLVGARLDISGGSVQLTRANITVSGASMAGASLSASGSSLNLSSSMEVTGPALMDLNGSSVRASVSFPSPSAAEGTFPGINNAISAGHGRFFPAVHMTGPSVATFTATEVRAVVLAGAAAVRSDIPVHAHLDARAEFYRLAAVEATDPNGVPVANASVVVTQASSNGTQVASVVAPSGTAWIPLLTDIIAFNTTLPVGSYKIHVSRGTVAAPTINLTFAQAPDFSAGSLVEEISVSLDIYQPWDIYDNYQFFNTTLPQTTQVWNTSFVFSSLANFTNADVLLVQSRPFERFIAFDAGSAMVMSGATIRSEYPFNLYLIGGASADVRASSLLNANILVTGGGSIALRDSRLIGSVLGQAGDITLNRSLVWAPRITVDARALEATDSVLAAETSVDLKLDDLLLTRVGLAGAWAPTDPASMAIPSWSTFNGLAGSPAAELTASPALAVRSGSCDVETLTVWTEGEFLLSCGAPGSSVHAGRLVTGPATFASTGAGDLTVEETWVDPESNVLLAGDGVVRVRGLASAAWAVQDTLTVHLYESILVRVTDGVGLPVEGADVVASALLEDTSNETTVTDSTGSATLYLHRSSITPTGSAPGATYRVSARAGNSNSASVTWDPTADSDIALALAETFARPKAEGLFAILFRGETNQLLASSVSIAGAVALLNECGNPSPSLGPAGIVYPEEAADGCLSADLVFEQGGEVRRRPMDGGTWRIDYNGTELANGTLDSAGLAVLSFDLPADAGNLTLNLTVDSPLLEGPYVMHPMLVVAEPPRLEVAGFLIKSGLDQFEAIKISGSVAYLNGTAVPNAVVFFTTSGGSVPASAETNGAGKFYVQGRTGGANGSFTISAVATAPRASPSEPTLFNFTVGSIPTPGGDLEQGGPDNAVLLLFSVVAFAGCGAVFYFALLQRRAARGEFVECGSCGRPTYASEAKCRWCKVEFEPGLAKCSHCNAWISATVPECPQCGTQFTKAVVPGEGAVAKKRSKPSEAQEAEYTVPDQGVPASAQRAAAGRLEEMEFRLPGTTETLDLGESGKAPTFVGGAPPPPPPAGTPVPGAPGSVAAPAWAREPTATDRPVERVGLGRREEDAGSVREIGSDEAGERAGREPVSFGTTRPDLAAPVPPPSHDDQEPEGAEGDEVAPEMLREILRQAAPELSDELLPSDIRKELDDIARSEAPAQAERLQATEKPKGPARQAPPEDRTMEAPEKSRKSAFDVFSRPAKNIPAGFEKRGTTAKQGSGGKGGAAPVCPNCGGNWVVQRDGKNSCRVCGTRW